MLQIGFFCEILEFVYIRYHKKKKKYFLYYFQKDLRNAVGYNKVRGLVYTLLEPVAFTWIAITYTTKMSSQYVF